MLLPLVVPLEFLRIDNNFLLSELLSIIDDVKILKTYVEQEL